MNKGEKLEHFIFGIVLLIVGLIFLVNNYYPELDLWSTIVKLWPVLLIAYGIKKLFIAQALRETEYEK
ncbi:MAG: hypothetical protein A2Y62_22280 [Candidatus Fischerbacteria bacterium RBG_13_37_8]|uniref:LiaI-LiaF-like transmembrane region domain-containing protein n=1 Tax=Candidatus Fischerbacteria bacterium RBG_13_37_8 TaxID=1817863 RepID=A0A1F5VJI3_9BACT|nr:MAG: hypothetical protein A2Y62_22280 [Candidatus Fischerbacteria bacterium RBG_13_37_8]